MKRLCLIALSILILLAGNVAVADPFVKLATITAEGCNITANPVGITSVWVYLWSYAPVSVKAVQFAAYKPECMSNAIWISDNVQQVDLFGSTQADVGLSLNINPCVSLPYSEIGYYLARIDFLVTSPVPACCVFQVTHPTYWDYYDTPGTAIDCDDNEIPVGGSSVVFNANETCPCDGALKTESTTWGKVKSLYR
jgi:hypothetical protein